MSISTEQLIAATYVAFFNRAPDADGLAFWAAEAERTGLNDVQLAGALAAGFVSHPSFDEIYGGMTDEAFVNAIYVNVGGKNADAAGLANATAALAAGATRASVVADFVFGVLNIPADVLDELVRSGEITEAEAADAVARTAYLTNRSEVALAFTRTLGERSNLDVGTDALDQASLERDAAYLASVAIVSDVTESPASRDAALALLATDPSIEDILLEYGIEVPGGASPVYNLITGSEDADLLQGTAGADRIEAGGGNDRLNGRAGDDELDGGTGADSVVYVFGDLPPGSDLAADISPSGISFDATGVAATGFGLIDADILSTDMVSNVETVGVFGSNFADSIIGGATDDFLAGGLGDDVISGGDGNDIMVGQAGDDRLMGGAGNDILGDDLVGFETFGGSGAGNDVLSGGDGDDSFLASAGNDSIDGGPGSDGVFYELGALGEGVSFSAFGVGLDGSGVISLEGLGTAVVSSIEAIALTGTNFEDTIIGSALADNLAGGSGNDGFLGSPGNDTINGGPGSDQLGYVFGEPFDVPDDPLFASVRIWFEDFDSPLWNVQSSINLDASSVDASGSGVISVAGWGEDTVSDLNSIAVVGSAFDDTISLGATDDVVIGDGGDDVLSGGGGFNVFFGDDGNDTIIGGPDTDWVLYLFNAGAQAAISVDASGVDANGSGVVHSGPPGTDTLSNVEVLLVYGSVFFDDTLIGGGTSDGLSGLGGNDTLIGGGGNDLLNGGPGKDSLQGGAGSDVFQFNAGAGQDTVLDFNIEEDSLELRDGLTGSSTQVDTSDPNDTAADTAPDSTRVVFSDGGEVLLLGVLLTDQELFGG